MALPIYQIIYLSMVWNGVVIYLHADCSSMHECLCDRLLVLCSVARCVGSFGSIIASKSFVNCCICMLSDAVVIVLRSTCDETACSENYKENSWCRSTVKIAVRKQGIRMGRVPKKRWESVPDGDEVERRGEDGKSC